MVVFETTNAIQESKKVIVGIYEWKQQRYDFSVETERSQCVTLASFKHLPLRLAWAMTIHKAQGLQFDNILADISKCWEPGQAYVALSRAKNVQGLGLTHLPSAAILKAKFIPDPKVCSSFAMYDTFMIKI